MKGDLLSGWALDKAVWPSDEIGFLLALQLERVPACFPSSL